MFRHSVRPQSGHHVFTVHGAGENKATLNQKSKIKNIFSGGIFIYIRIILILSVIILKLGLSASILEAAPRVVINDRPITFDVEPYIERDRVMVPMRAIFEALGSEVEWDPDVRSVTARQGGSLVLLIIDSSTAFRYREGIDSKMMSVSLDVPPQIVGDRTMVPLRFVSESLNALVEWKSNNQTVYIKK